MNCYDLSLCMIVHNEEDQIENCLLSVKDIVQEIIIVDTGSTDRTREIAEKFGAKVIAHLWNGDFSAARNVGIAECTCNWILVLDADEEWDAQNNGKLEQLLKDEAIYAYSLKIINYYGKTRLEEDYVTDSVCRLFRNLPHIQFRGMIHEEVTKSITEHYSRERIAFTDAVIRHYGYLDDVIGKKNKNKRNMEIVKKALDKMPSDYYLQYALGTEYFQSMHFSKALEVFEPLVGKVSVIEGYASDLLYKTVVCLKELNELHKALHLIQQGKSFYPDFIDLLEMESLILFELHRYEDSIDTLLKCLQIGDVSNIYSSSSGAGTYKTHYLLGLANERRCCWEDALQHYSKVLGEQSAFHAALIRWLNLILYHHPSQYEFIKKLNAQFTHLSLDGWMIVLMQAVRWVRPDIGFSFLEKLSSFNVDDLQMNMLKGIFLTQSRNYEEARQLLMMLQKNDNHIFLDLYLWNINQLLGDSTEEKRSFNRIVAEDPAYAALYEVITHKNFNVTISGNIYMQTLNTMLSTQNVAGAAFLMDYQLQQVLENSSTPQCLVSKDMLPGFRLFPKQWFYNFIERSYGCIAKLDYVSLLFLGWAAIRLKEYGAAFEALRQAKQLHPQRLEHTFGFSCLLKDKLLKEQHLAEYNRLLLIF